MWVAFFCTAIAVALIIGFLEWLAIPCAARAENVPRWSGWHGTQPLAWYACRDNACACHHVQVVRHTMLLDRACCALCMHRHVAWSAATFAMLQLVGNLIVIWLSKRGCPCNVGTFNISGGGSMPPSLTCIHDVPYVAMNKVDCHAVCAMCISCNTKQQHVGLVLTGWTCSGAQQAFCRGSLT